MPLALSIGSTAQAAEPTTGGAIRYAVAEESRGMDPVTSLRSFADTAIHVHDSLVVMDTNNKAFGDLAESWEVNPEATEYTIKLRKDVVFQDGSKFDANAVKAHFTRVFDKAYCCSNATQYMTPYVGTDIIDDYTLKVKFSKPWGQFSQYIGLSDVTAIPSNAGWEKYGKDMNLKPIGAGPFTFVEWVPQSHILFKRNDAYKWGPALFENQGPPHVDTLEVKFIADQATRTACVESGDCDIVKDPSYADLRRLADNPDFTINKIPETGMPFSFVFNTQRFPTDSLAVRKAINLAVDREKINAAAFLGEREPLYTTLTPRTPEFWEGAKALIYYKPEESKQILADAGYKDTDGDGVLEKDGKPVVLDLFIFGNRESNPAVIVAESIQSDLAAIGIKVNIEVRPWDDQSVIAMKNEHNLINFDMPLPTASVLGVMFNSRETPTEGHYGMGFTWFEKSNADLSKQLDALLDAGDNASTFEVRKEKFVEAQKIIGENYLGLPISAGSANYIMTSKLAGVKYNASGDAMFNDAYFVKQ
jgi:peptide/nickel transport system substrate-binding protein